MKLEKRSTYKGYKSYSYLEDKDFKHFELSPEMGRVEPYIVDLNQEQENRFEQIMGEGININLHEHPSVIPNDVTQLMAYEKVGREFTGFEGLAYSYWDAIFDNCMDGTCVMSSDVGWKWQDVVHDFCMRSADIAHQDFLFKATTVEDIYKAKRENRIAWFLSMEGCAPIENELDRIDILYGLGVRMMGITYSESNALGSGIREPRDGGLTLFGHKAVERMNKLGVAIDLSHTGDLTAMDVIKCSKKPVFITHVGARSLWDSKRLKPDDVLKACAEYGGVVGVEAAPHTTITAAHPRHNLDSVMEHFEYMVNLCGIDHVAFGPDTLYGDHVGLHDVFSSNMSTKTTNADQYERVEYIQGVENPTEASYNFVRWMIKHGYSNEDIIKAMGGNVIRALKEIWC